MYKIQFKRSEVEKPDKSRGHTVL